MVCASIKKTGPTIGSPTLPGLPTCRGYWPLVSSVPAPELALSPLLSSPELPPLFELLEELLEEDEGPVETVMVMVVPPATVEPPLGLCEMTVPDETLELEAVSTFTLKPASSRALVASDWL